MQQVDQTWQEYRTRLVRFVRSKVHNDVVAEDIVHDALVKAWTKRSTLHDESALLPWLFQITMNAVRDHHRVRHHDVVVSDIDPEDQPTPEDLHHIAVCLTSMISTLEEPYRSAVHRSEIDGIPMRVIADELNISLSGVKSRVQRGKSKLKDLVLACCQFEVNTRGQITNSDEHQCTNPECGCTAS